MRQRLVDWTATGLMVALIPMLLFVAASGTLAAKGEGGKGRQSAAISVVVLAPPDANYGEQVTFEVSTTATDQPLVQLDCFQGGTKVYWASAGFYDDYPWPWARDFTLRSTYWTGGAADCTASLYYFDGRRYRTLTSTSFAVAP